MTRLRFGTGGIPRPITTGILDAIPWLEQNNLHCMELEFVHSTWLKEEAAEELKKQAKKADVTLTAHGSYYINLNAAEEKKREASRNRVIGAAHRTWQAGGESVTFHPAFYLKQDPEKVYAQVKEQMKLILQELHNEGVDITISPETTGKPTQMGTYEELCKLASELEGMSICVDFAHLHARTNGAYNTYEEYSKVLETVENYLGKERLRNMHIHLSGIEYGPKGEKNHLTCVESDMNWDALFKAFKDYSVGGCVISESPIIEEDALWMKKKYEGI